MNFYRERPTASVPEPVRRAANTALDFARTELGLAYAPRVRWFERTTAMPSLAEQILGLGWFTADSYLAGQAGRRELWLRADLAAEQAAHAALHEVCHLYQQQLAGAPRGEIERAGREGQAQQYSNDLGDIARAIATTGG